MVKAKKVKGIKCNESAVVNARRIILVRLDEMMSFEKYVDQSDNIKQIHDLRIAAKRLRYTLEMFRFAFPKGLNKLIKEVKTVQSSIGDMRDADVMVARVSNLVDENSVTRSARLMDIATATERGTVSQRRHRMKSAIASPAVPRDELAFYTLIAHRTDDSIAAYERFQATWDEMMESDFPGRLRRFVGIDPSKPGPTIDEDEAETTACEENNAVLEEFVNNEVVEAAADFLEAVESGTVTEQNEFGIEETSDVVSPAEDIPDDLPEPVE